MKKLFNDFIREYKEHGPIIIWWVIQGKVSWFLHKRAIRKYVTRMNKCAECAEAGQCKHCGCDFNAMSLSGKPCKTLPDTGNEEFKIELREDLMPMLHKVAEGNCTLEERLEVMDEIHNDPDWKQKTEKVTEEGVKMHESIQLAVQKGMPLKVAIKMHIAAKEEQLQKEKELWCKNIADYFVEQQATGDEFSFSGDSLDSSVAKIVARDAHDVTRLLNSYVEKYLKKTTESRKITQVNKYLDEDGK